jgi:hypothetical protein
MSILRKSLDAITIEDLDALIDSESRETAELEFKGTLPFVRQKGQPQTADRWIENGDRIGEYARDQILSELVAFANADGGTLILGMHETKDEPRRAARLEALPKCEDLARRLLDACEDIVEPRLPTVNVRAFPVNDTGHGYVVMRVGKSLSGPHRLKSTREFYVRRGERSVKMDVREIRDVTLELARTGDRIERVFQERRDVSKSTFKTLVDGPDKEGPGPLIIRVSALPMASQMISNITSRQDLWWRGQGFTMMVGNVEYQCEYPAREFAHQPEIRLRSLVSDASPEDGGSQRILRADGLVEFSLVHPRREPFAGGKGANRFYVGWIMSLLVGALAQLHQLRTSLAWDAVEFGMEIEIVGELPLALLWDDRGLSGGLRIKGGLPLILPRYSVLSASNYDPIVLAVIRDLFNASGRSFDQSVLVPWPELGVGA